MIPDMELTLRKFLKYLTNIIKSELNVKWLEQE